MVGSTAILTPAATAEDFRVARTLFREYVASLGIDLSFQGIDAELDDLPGKYAAPAGLILIARDAGGDPLGCVALRPLADPASCEMKRLYVRPAARGLDLGRRLAQAIIDRARLIGYARISLDTLPTMAAAQALYASLGFRGTAAYYASPVAGTIYLALDL